MKEHMIISQYISDGVGKEKRPRRARICFSGSKAGVKGKTFPDFIKVIIVIPVIKFHKVFGKNRKTRIFAGTFIQGNWCDENYNCHQQGQCGSC